MSRKFAASIALAICLVIAVLLVLGNVSAQLGQDLSNGASTEYSSSGSSQMIVSYKVIGGGSPLAPTITYVTPQGNQQSLKLPANPVTITTGKNKPWSVAPNPLGGSTSTERWFSTDTLSGKSPNSGSGTYVFGFQHQYYVTLGVSPPGAGTTSPSGTNYYNSGQIITITATPKDGNAFVSWSKTGSIGIVNTAAQTSTATVGGAGSITATFSKPVKQQETDLSITFSPTKVDKTKGQSTVISGFLTSNCNGLSSETITLFYCPIANQYSWTEIGTITTGAGGYYHLTWIPTIPNGQYFVKAVFAGDANYKSQTALTSCNGVHLTVVPEYFYGALAALFACFVAFAFFKKANRRN